MTETPDAPVANWQRRIGSLGKRGRISAATLAVRSASREVDVRDGAPAASGFLSPREAYGSGCSRTAGRNGQRIEAALRQAELVAREYYRMVRLHRQMTVLCAFRAVKLRLVPSAKEKKKPPTDGDSRSWPKRLMLLNREEKLC